MPVSIVCLEKFGENFQPWAVSTEGPNFGWSIFFPKFLTLGQCFRMNVEFFKLKFISPLFCTFGLRTYLSQGQGRVCRTRRMCADTGQGGSFNRSAYCRYNPTVEWLILNLWAIFRLELPSFFSCLICSTNLKSSFGLPDRFFVLANPALTRSDSLNFS